MKLIFYLLLIFPFKLFAAFEWQSGFPRDRVLNREEALILPNYNDTLNWKTGAMFVHPYGISQLNFGEFDLKLNYNRSLFQANLSQLGLDGYRENKLGMRYGYKIRNWWGAIGAKVGWVDVPPIKTKYAYAPNVEVGWKNQLISTYVLLMIPSTSNQSFSLPDDKSVTIQYQPFSDWEFNITTNLQDKEYTHSVGGSWSPFQEVMLFSGSSFEKGWGAGVQLNYGNFSITYSSTLVEPLGWSSLWSVQLATVKTKQKGYKYPVSIP